MPSEKPALAANDLAAWKERLRDVRDRAARLAEGPATGFQLAAALSSGMDDLLVDLWEACVSQQPPERRSHIEQQCTITATGGYGRRTLAPFSDVDLLILHSRQSDSTLLPVIEQFVRAAWDAGLKLGHSVRSRTDALAMAKKDIPFATSVADVRLLCGHEPRLLSFRRRLFHQIIAPRRRGFTLKCLEERDAERRKHGPAVNQLEPDLKRARGGLRDAHLMRWLGFAHYGETEFESLRLRGVLARDDARRMLDALEFLWRLRIELHFRRGNAGDTLTRDDQLAIADARGYEDEPGRRGVEKFMQDYFRQSSRIADVSRRFADRHRPGNLRGRVRSFFTSHKADDIYRVDHARIDVLPEAREAVLSSITEMTRLYSAALLYGVTTTPELHATLRDRAPQIDAPPARGAYRSLMEIFGRSKGLGKTLREMFSIGLLEKLIPSFGRVRGLLQFNQYHSFTVDEHTFRAIEAAESLNDRDDHLGRVYRKISHPEILHLAILLHDAGKGYDEDHSDVGRRIAIDVAGRIGLPPHHADELEFLVHRHLEMSHLAFRRNFHDPDILMEFVRKVGSPEILQMLYCLTACDLMAVGPDVWNEWKGDVLAELYRLALRALSGRPPEVEDRDRQAAVRSRVLSVFEETIGLADSRRDWLDEQIQSLSPTYLSTAGEERIADALVKLAQLGAADALAEGEFDAETETTEYRVYAGQQRAPGVFHKITAALTGKGMAILAADITTGSDGRVIDRFQVKDGDNPGAVSPARIEEVCRVIEQSVRDELSLTELVSRGRRVGRSDIVSPPSELPPRVVIDNHTSEASTVVDVFANDRFGLLYDIARRIHELGLSVELAKIATALDQVLDVFYLTENGSKLHDAERIETLRAELMTVIT